MVILVYIESTMPLWPWLFKNGLTQVFGGFVAYVSLLLQWNVFSLRLTNEFVLEGHFVWERKHCTLPHHFHTPGRSCHFSWRLCPHMAPGLSCDCSYVDEGGTHRCLGASQGWPRWNRKPYVQKGSSLRSDLWRQDLAYRADDHVKWVDVALFRLL